MVEEVGDGPFLACSFEFAPGRLPNREEWNPALWQLWGAVQARTHRLAADYVLPEGMEHRFTFFEEPYLVAADDNFADEPEVLEKWRGQKSAMEGLPTGGSVYGLIHTDLYQANFHVDGGRMVMFDSDDCGCAWFAEDISSSIYYGSTNPDSGEDRGAWVAEFLPAYWSGYRTEHDLSDEWLDLLPLFLMGRTFLIYSMLHTKWDLDDLTAERREHMAIFRSRIESGEAWWTSLDFRGLANG